MEHPDFTKGFREISKKARKHYHQKKAIITGPDGRQRPARVAGTIIHETIRGEWEVCCHFLMERLDNSNHPLEADWSRQYLPINHSWIDWSE